MRLIKTLAFAVAPAMAAFGGGLFAQQQATATPPTPERTGKAGIAGVVVDSLRGRYLRGADVIIEGGDAHTVTDSAGKFRIEGLPPGTYRVGVFHPLLDTLSITLATEPFRAGPDSTSITILAVPSAATIIRGVCGPRSGEPDNSAVIGSVNESESLRPVAGAEVSIAWIEIEVSREVGIRETPHVLRDTTDAVGAFHICGLPNSMDATLKARKGKAVTGEVPISLGDAAAELVARTLLLSMADSGTIAGGATVSGRVILSGGAPNAASRVELVGTDIVVLTNEKGEFTMGNIPSGSYVLLARHLGYGAQTVPVDLSQRAAQKVTITLPKFVAIMDPVLVTARRSASLDRVGFNQRKKSGSGYFIGPEKIQRIRPHSVSDILRQVPGLRMTYSGMRSSVSSRRGPSSFRNVPVCVRYFLDGMRWLSTTPGDIEGFVNGNEVVAAEVYNDTNVPARYMSEMGSCTTILLWTRLRIHDLTER